MKVFGLARPEWGYFALGTLFSLLMAFSGPLLPRFVVNPLFGQVIGEKNFSLLPTVLLNACGLLFLSIVAYYAQNTLFAIGGAKFGQRCRQAVFAALVKTSLLDLMPNDSGFSSGGRTARLSLDLRELENFYTNELPILTGQGLTIVVAMVLLFLQNPNLTLGLVIATIPLAVVLGWVGKQIQTAFARTQEAAERASASMSESLSRLDVIKAFRLENEMLRRFSEQNQAQTKASLVRTNWANLSSPVSQLTVGAGVGVLVWLALGQIQLGRMDGVSLTEYLTMLIIVIAPMQLFAFAFARFSAMRDPVESLETTLAMPPENDTGTLDTPQQGWSGNIEFANVQVRYPNSPELALDALNVRIASGQMVAFVGSSGGGKTTLIRVLLRFLEPSAGVVKLDGQDLLHYRRGSVRSAIAYVPQQPSLFAGTVAQNLRLARPDATPEALWQVLREVGLDNELNSKNGLETQIGEGGQGLSGGQQQRLAIARALLTGAAILILDEPTAALDTNSENLIKTTLEHLRGKHTIIVIAHRLSTIEHADQIFVMQYGKIIEQGSHQHLLGLGGVYQTLARTLV